MEIEFWSYTVWKIKLNGCYLRNYFLKWYYCSKIFHNFCRHIYGGA